MDIGDNLKLYRKAHNLSQSNLADRLHVSRKTISGWENNRSYPDIDTLNALAKIYGVTIDELLVSDPSFLTKKIKLEMRRKRILKFSYILNIPLCILGYFELTGFNGFNSPFVTLLLLANIITFFTNYTVSKFKILRSLSIIILFLIIFSFNIKIGAYGNASEPYLTHDLSFNIGVILACLIHATLSSISVIMLLFHNFYKFRHSRLLS